jgi:hypothetical protein
MQHFKTWFLVCVILKLLDVITTYLALTSGGIELNPIVGYLISSLGLIGGLVVVFLIFLVAISFIRKNYLFIILVITHAIVVINNLIAIWRLQ